MQAVIDILSNIGFDWRVALANLFNFIIIFLLLDRFVFGIVRRSLKNRKETIEKGVQDAHKAETALVMAKEEKKGILKDAQVQANAITAEAFNKAKETVSQSVKDAEAEAAQVLIDAEKKIELKKKEAQKQIEKEAIDMVISGMEKILRDEMTPELQEKMVKRISV